jgi:hypothetical protein
MEYISKLSNALEEHGYKRHLDDTAATGCYLFHDCRERQEVLRNCYHGIDAWCPQKFKSSGFELKLRKKLSLI